MSNFYKKAARLNIVVRKEDIDKRVSMNHKHVIKNVILFIDKTLPEKEMRDMKAHFETCSSCADNLKRVSEVYKSDTYSNPSQPSPYLWTKLNNRIKNYEKQPLFLYLPFKWLFLQVRVIAYASIIGFAVMLGIQFGKISMNSNNQFVETRSSEDELFYYANFLDSFEGLPPESVGGVYMTIAFPQK